MKKNKNRRANLTCRSKDDERNYIFREIKRLRKYLTPQEQGDLNKVMFESMTFQNAESVLGWMTGLIQKREDEPNERQS
jgi:hypothetical protein